MGYSSHGSEFWGDLIKLLPGEYQDRNFLPEQTIVKEYVQYLK